MGVTKTYTFACDLCKRTVIMNGGGLPKGWIRTYRQRFDGTEGEGGIFCSAFCATKGLVHAEEEEKGAMGA